MLKMTLAIAPPMTMAGKRIEWKDMEQREGRGFCVIPNTTRCILRHSIPFPPAMFIHNEYQKGGKVKWTYPKP